MRSMFTEWSGSSSGEILVQVLSLRSLSGSGRSTSRLSRTAVSEGGTGCVAFTIKHRSAAGAGALQHECAGIRKSPQCDPIVRQHSISEGFIATPGIRQTIEGVSSDNARIRPTMKCVRYMESLYQEHD